MQDFDKDQEQGANDCLRRLLDTEDGTHCEVNDGCRGLPLSAVEKQPVQILGIALPHVRFKDDDIRAWSMPAAS
jgi:hypothetical protein